MILKKRREGRIRRKSRLEEHLSGESFLIGSEGEMASREMSLVSNFDEIVAASDVLIGGSEKGTNVLI